MIKAGEIFLSDVMPIQDPKQYKIHLAVKNEDGHQPLDAFVMSFDKWKGWNSYRGSRNRFNRAFIFSMMDFYPQNGIWLFGGIWEVLERKDDWYEVALTDLFPEMIGRLKIKFPYTARTRSLKLNRYYAEMTVHEMLPKIYDGEAFRGYENIRLSFNELHTILSKQRTDWKTALENIYGIYLIMDRNNGYKYVGSAYGGTGIWSRWNQYIMNGHGGNTELKKLMEQKGLEYARNYYQFSLLEYMPASTSDSAVISRENYWKEVLLSRGDFGYNAN